MSAKPEAFRRGIGIQMRLFLLTAVILMSNLLLLLLLGSTTFEWLYLNEKEQYLKKGANQIAAAYQSSGIESDECSEALSSVESRNVTVRVFHQNEAGEITADYYSRGGFGPAQFDQRKIEHFSMGFLNDFYTSGTPERLEAEKYVLIGDENANGRPQRGNIILYTSLGGGVYLSLDTPRQFIAETAELAIKSCAAIALVTLLFAGVALYFVCRRIAAPIREIQRSAESIAELDFNARCKVRSRDELGRLAQSINDMADSLNENIRNLESANQMLRHDLHRTEQQDNLRKRFIANVSHDFKTPLTLITSYAESLRELDDEQRDLRAEYCDIISSEGYKMNHQVQSLLNLSRLESGMIQLSRMAFPINEVINEITHRHGILTEKKRLTVERDLPDEIIVHADYQRVELAFTNLFENAVKYASEGGTVRVSARRNGGLCLVRVFNTGEPIAQEDLEKLFISFYRADKARGGQSQSYGLGLAIVRSIMDLHGRGYGVHNAPGGVEFWLDLDIADIDGAEDEDDDG